MSRSIPLVVFTALAAFGVARETVAKGANDIDIVAVDAGVNFDGRFEVLAVAVNGGLYHRWQLTNSEDWSDWELLATGQHAEVRAWRASDGRLFAFALDGGVLVVRAQTAPNAGWSADEFRSGHDLAHLAVATNNDGGLTVAAIGGDGQLYVLHSLAKPAPSPDAWSPWDSLGGAKLRKILAERDGDGIMNVAALDLLGRTLLIQHQSQDADSGWTDWQDMSTGTAGTRDIALARGGGHVLWLFAATAAGNYKPDGLYGRSLTPLNPAPPPAAIGSEVPSPPVDPRSVRPAPRENPRSRVPPSRRGGSAAAASTRVTPPPPRAQWSDWIRIISQGVLGGDHVIFSGGPPILLLQIATSSGERIEVAANNDSREIVHLTQAADGTWPTDWERLPTFALVKEFASVSLGLGHAASGLGSRGRAARLFVTDKIGTVSTIGRTSKDAFDSLPAKEWRSLGRIPGPADADMLFQARQCLDKLVDSPDDIRLGITTGVPAELGKALAGTPIEKVIDDDNAISQCTPRGETMGLWLDHQAWRPSLLSADIVPTENTFGLLISRATVDHIFDAIWKAQPKHLNLDGDPDPHGDLELQTYSVDLAEPNQLSFTLRGQVRSAVPFSATVSAAFAVKDGVPACDVSVSVDASLPGLAGVMSIVLAQFTAPLIGKIQEGVESAQRSIAKKAPLVCRLTDALVSELFLPKPKDDSKPRQVLEVVYDGIKISPAQGILGFGLTPPAVHARNPSVKLVVIAIPLGRESAKIAVSYQLQTHDLKPPLMATWTTSNVTPLDTINYNSGNTPVAIITYPIPSRPPPYALGRINVVVTDADGLTAESHKEVLLTAADLGQ